MRLNPKHLTVHELLQGRLFRIPNYQRAYSWGKKQRDELFADISEVKRSGQDHFMATIVTLVKEKRIIYAEEYQVVDLVDGQQRLTTIIILLKAIEKSLKGDDRATAKMKRELSELLIKGDEHSLVLLQTNHDSGDFFIEYVRNGHVSKKSIDVSSDKNIVDAQNECELFTADWLRAGSIIDLLAIVRNRLSVVYHELNDESSVYRIFEVLNSRGLDVKWIDKFKSQAMSLIFFHADTGVCTEALDEMHVIWQEIYKMLGLRDVLGDDALRFAGTLKLPSRPNRQLTQEMAAGVLADEAGTTLKSIVASARWLKAVVAVVCEIDADHRLSAVTRIAHARFVAISIKLKGFEASLERRLLAKWENTTFKIFGICGADSRYCSGDYMRLGYEIVRENLAEHEIVGRFDQISSKYSVEEIINQRDYWNHCYYNWEEELRYLLYRFEEYTCKKRGEKLNYSQWNKIWLQNPSSSIEHVSPQSQNHEYVHHLGNLTMLPPGLNSSLKDKKPADKAESYHTCGLRETTMVGSIIAEHGWGKKQVIERAVRIQDFMLEEWG